MFNFDSTQFDLKILDIAEFPHEELNNIVEGKNGIIEFYKVAPNTKVMSLNEDSNTYEWVDVKYWSVHKARKVEIVTLANGTQIITDDDPRAIYGVTYENLKNKNFIFERATPTEAKEKNIFVPAKPIKQKAVIDINQIDWDAVNNDLRYLSLTNARAFVNELFAHGIIAEIHEGEDDHWKISPTKENGEVITINDDLVFLSIQNIEKTNKYEDGYDLTVDGPYQTFMTAQGNIISNTINIHVPGLPEAQKEMREKLLPSKQIYGIRNVPKKGKDGEPIEQEEVMNKLKQDLLIGMYAANKNAAKRKWLFATEKEALAAIKAGKVHLSDEVEILDK